MRFDRTGGKRPRYIVSEYWETGEDHYYFHYYRNAKFTYDYMKARALIGTRLSLYDMVKDIQKEYESI